ncbi:MAG: hypothetical protein ACO3FA_05895 [Vulcanococcus sp.]|jgi:nuclear transport factor 2 (NTF2) superfamily protein
MAADLPCGRFVMPLPIPDKPGQLFANADSFAMAFDEAWQRQERSASARELPLEEKRRRVLEACGDHPFMLSEPSMAEQVADFRIRLLDL